MKTLILFKTTIPPLLVSVLLVCFALCPAPNTFGVSPAPDGGYPGGTTAEGTNALFSLTSGVWNTALGFEALNHDTAGKDNTATGIRALFSDTSGSNNTATGVYALYSNTIGWYNNAAGDYALSNNTTGNYNTATGYGALYRNTTSDQNTADGFGALYKNTTGDSNVAVGFQALNKNIDGDGNTANGAFALFSNTGGDDNVAVGEAALESNNTGALNTASGYFALSNETTGTGNVAMGYFAGMGLSTGSYNIDIGNEVPADESFTIRIGASQTATFIAGIYGVNEGGTPLTVYINSDGQLGTMSSSRRFKKEIKAMDKASEAILALKPVTFHYKSDNKGTPQFGLIAEEVAEVNPNLVVRDAKGEIYSVRYDAVNAMLLNEFLKEHRKVEEQGRKVQQQEATITQLRSDAAKQDATISQLKKGMEVFAATLKEQDSKIQKVSDQLEVSKPMPQIVLNNQ